MGDHRASIKIEFSMYGLTEKYDGWINWSPDSSECPEIDRRIIDFFRQSYLKMRGIFDDRQAKYFAERDRQVIEEQERAELARLQAKYPPPASGEQK